MPTIQEILAMCRAGNAQNAYVMARTAMDSFPDDVWVQRGVGWALYYLIKTDKESANYQSLVAHLEELRTLHLLTVPQDNMIFENVLFKVAGFVREDLSPTNVETPTRLSTIFAILRNYRFDASNGYSFLLQSFIKCRAWQEMNDFIDWWDLNKLLPQDYIPFQMQNGRVVMSKAEQAYIAKARALLRLNDATRIRQFLPMLESIMNNYPQMTYPGYFYGKLLLSLGNAQEDALRILLPFARMKSTEFWVWQLISEVFVDNPENQLACLLRAVHCRAQENFLGKVRIRLAQLFIQRNQYEFAKFQIDRITQCRLANGWTLPYEVECWIHQPWINTVVSRDCDTIDYQNITNGILYEGTDSAIAVVTYLNSQSRNATLVYGWEKRMTKRLRFEVEVGNTLEINYVTEQNGTQRLLSARKTELSTNLDYVKVIEGTVSKRTKNDFAFLKATCCDCYISSDLVRKFNLRDNETIRCLVAYDYNRNKEKWNWICLKIIR